MTLKRGTLWMVVATLAVTLTMGTATAVAQNLDTSGVTLDPGTENPKDQLMSRALKLFIEQGYDPDDYDFQSTTFKLDVGAVFIPKLDAKWANRQFQFVGVIYTEEQINFSSSSLEPGLHPLNIAFQRNNQATKKTQAPANLQLYHEGVNFTAGFNAGIYCGKSVLLPIYDCVVGGGFSAGGEVPVDPPNPPSPEQVGNTLSQLVDDLFQGFCGATKGRPCQP